MDSLDYENNNGSGKQLKVHFDVPEGEDYQNYQQKDSPSSISSESSLNSDDSKDEINSIDNLELKYVNGYGSPVWSFQSGSVTQSSPIHIMSPSSYDPNRIPSSIFASKPTSPMDWSVASNESLFSLHLGNNSFSRDFLFNNKSGELPRTNDFLNGPTTLAPVEEGSGYDTGNDEKVADERHSMSSISSDEIEDILDMEEQHKRTSNETEGLVVKDDNHGKTKTLGVVETNTLDLSGQHDSKAPVVVHVEEPKKYNPSVSYRSVESDMSNRSFQFPILTVEGLRTSSEIVESEKHDKQETQQHQYHHQPPENPGMMPPSPETDNPESKQSVSRNWCCFSCFCCSSCF